MKFATWSQAMAVVGLVAACAACDPGRIAGWGFPAPPKPVIEAPGPNVAPVVLHRLNRLEYNNTVRDLLGTTLQPANVFPVDVTVNGFDNQAAALTLSPALLQQYDQAAQSLANELDAKPAWQTVINPQTLAVQNPNAGGNAFSNWAWNLANPFNVPIQVSQDDTVTISVQCAGAAVNVAGIPEVAGVPQMAVAMDGNPIMAWTVTADVSAPQVQNFALPMTAGAHVLTFSFVNAFSDAGLGIYNQLELGTVTATSSQIVPGAGHASLFVCDPNAVTPPLDCWHAIVLNFLQRAWRRPLPQDQIDAAFELWQTLAAANGDAEALKILVRGTLVSAKFLYRTSFVADPNAVVSGALDDYDLASRLSYFLWGSMPDAALLGDAAAGTLHTDAGLRAEVTRMLADPKAQGLLDGFAAQWLGLRDLAVVAPDSTLFPEWDDTLRDSMVSEGEAFFADFLHNGRAVQDLVWPDFAFVNDRLATHYGYPLPGSTNMVKVAVPEGQRQGVMMLGGWLVSRSLQTRTSPVKRGRFVLENLLCETVPPPPPDIPALPTTGSAANLTVREQLAMHVNAPSCAGCHTLLDPPGLGLEEFDAVAAKRALENGAPVDTSGGLLGQNTANAAQMAQVLHDNPLFSYCVVQQLFTYALGRALVQSDLPYVTGVFSAVNQGQGSLDALVLGIVLSAPFRNAPVSGGP